jgi:hypothetical protein
VSLWAARVRARDLRRELSAPRLKTRSAVRFNSLARLIFLFEPEAIVFFDRYFVRGADLYPMRRECRA